MFTGIITDVGKVASTERTLDTRVVIETSYDIATVAIGASICCNGVCLTVVDKADGWFAADVSDETLKVTAMGDWAAGTLVNLERSLKIGDELGGHIVTGHVDCVGRIVTFDTVAGSMLLKVEVPAELSGLVAKKGSICVDGTSLTVNDVEDGSDTSIVSINLVPHTWDNTRFRDSIVGDKVNIEFDVLARYVARLQVRG